MRALLLQQASGEHEQLLDLTAAYHARYAARHRMDFWPIRGLHQTERHPVWDKIVVLLRALHSPDGYEYVFWIDADALIVRPDCDLRTSLKPGKELGMCIHPHPWHFNAGVLYIRNTASMRAFFQRVWDAWPVYDGWEEQTAMNRIIAGEWMAGFQILPSAWNSTCGVNDSARPIVRAWHGFPSSEGRREQMTLALAAAEKMERTLMDAPPKRKRHSAQRRPHTQGKVTG